MYRGGEMTQRFEHDWCLRPVLPRVGTRSLVASLVVVLALALGLPSGAVGQTFTYTGHEQAYAVPAGVTQVHVVVVGAPGGDPGGGYSGPIRGGIGAVV